VYRTQKRGKDEKKDSILPTDPTKSAGTAHRGTVRANRSSSAGRGGGERRTREGEGQVTTHCIRRTAEDGKRQRGHRIPPRCAVP